MAGEPAQFEAFTAQWSKQALKRTELAIEYGATDITAQVVANTPVRQGFLRDSWFAAIGTPPAGIGVVGTDPLIRLRQVFQSFKLGQTIVVGNTAPYALRIHFGFVGTDRHGRNFHSIGRHWVTDVMNRAPSIATAAATRAAQASIGIVP